MSDKPGIDSIFCSAIEVESPDERQALVEQACGEDVDLKHQVERLLHAHFHGRSILDAPVKPVATVDDSLAETAGAVIGPYKLLQQIGAGGMGVVWMAEQTQPVQRKVAIKVIKPGMDSSQVIARFEAERQALSMMDHVNIARVFDGGTTENGRPYFVMELVHGVPITKYCDDNHLTPRERLELFVPVCQAIQHAHQKGIIHRDIKPSNVMVTLYDGKPVPKVIDFGVAKATEQKLTERTLFTQYGTMVGTLEYMSPEQAEMSALGIDTRSDIYSLGVLLYELLTGSTPLTHKRMKEAAYAEILRMIKEEEPPRPSTRLSDSGEALASISAQRQMEPAKLTKLVKGELDWIVMKTLEKDRIRRYETASDFAADVQRYLNDDSVLACPASAVYRFKKFLRRHQGPAIAALLVVAALVAGLIAASWQAVLAREAETKAIEERDAKDKALKAERIAREEAVLAGTHTLEALRSMTDAHLSRFLASQVQVTDVDRLFFKKVLSHHERLASFKGNSPESRALRAEGHYRLGHIHNRLQEWPDALSAFERARDLYQQLNAESPDVPGYRISFAKCQNCVGQALVELGRLPEAEMVIRQSLEQFQRLNVDFPGHPEHHAEIGKIHGSLAGVFAARGRLAEAEVEWRHALRADKEQVAMFPEEHNYQHRVAMWHLRLGLLLETQKMPAEAEAEVRHAFAIQKRLTAEHANIPGYRAFLANAHRHLGRLLGAQRKRTESEVEYRAALVIENKLAAEFPAIPAYRQDLARTHTALGKLLMEVEKADDAVTEYRQAIAFQQRLVADFPDNASYRDQLAQSYSALGHALKKLGMLDQAITAYRQAVQLQPRFPGAYTQLLDTLTKAGGLDAVIVEYEAKLRGASEDALSHYLLGQALMRKRRWEDAADHFSRVLVLKAIFPEVHVKRGSAYAALGLWENAIKDYSREIELRPGVASTHNTLARLLATCPDPRHRNPPRAVAEAKRAVELAPTQFSHWTSLGAAQYRAGEWKAAVAALEKSMELRRGGNSFDSFLLAMSHWQLGNTNYARKCYAHAVQWLDKNQPINQSLQEEAAELLGVKTKQK